MGTVRTFQEAREIHLCCLDKAYQELRQIAADPLWCNDRYRTYKEVMDKIQSILETLRCLNAAEQEVNL